MSVVMGVMLFLTVLAGAMGLGTAGAARGLERQLAGRLTVQAMRADEATVERLADALRGVPGVTRVMPVPRDQLAKLLEPWLGDAGLDADLPMPAMIDVDISEPGTADRVRHAAAAIVPGARADAAAAWLSPVRSFVLSLAWLAGGIVLLVATATAAIVLLTARSGLDQHRDTIGVLHMLGSTDVQVAGLFQRRIALDTLVGGAIGTALALLTTALIGGRIAALDPAVAAGAGLGTVDWALLAAAPLVFTALAAIAARVAVLSALRRQL
jgi:cell division transport system permease protein